MSAFEATALDLAARQIAGIVAARKDIRDTVRKTRQQIDDSRALIAEIDAIFEKR